MSNQQRIVCAANRMPDGTLFIGIRHWDHFMRRQAQEFYPDVNEEYVAQAEQGFIDQWGVFYGRVDAWEIALAAGQIYRRGPGFSGPELYSENLY